MVKNRLMIHVVGEIPDVAGWHVNTNMEMPEIEQFKVTPAEPHNVLDGVATYYYRFEHEQEAYAHLGSRLYTS